MKNEAETPISPSTFHTILQSRRNLAEISPSCAKAISNSGRGKVGTFWALSGHFLGTPLPGGKKWALFGHFLGTFWALSGHFLGTFWELVLAARERRGGKLARIRRGFCSPPIIGVATICRDDVAPCNDDLLSGTIHCNVVFSLPSFGVRKVMRIHSPPAHRVSVFGWHRTPWMPLMAPSYHSKASIHEAHWGIEKAISESQGQ